MASANTLMADVNLRYRNTFTLAQKLVWLNEEKRELFDVLEIESSPYAFKTVAGIDLYPFPAGFDPTKIRTVTYQVNDGEQYREVPVLVNDDNSYTSQRDTWYSIMAGNMLLNIPGGPVEGRNVYIFLSSDSTDVTEATAAAELDLPVKYQEILKFGVLERIAEARKDIVMKNNYTVEKEQKISELMWSRKMQEPEWTTVQDAMPQRAGEIRGWRGWW